MSRNNEKLNWSTIWKYWHFKNIYLILMSIKFKFLLFSLTRLFQGKLKLFYIVYLCITFRPFTISHGKIKIFFIRRKFIWSCTEIFFKTTIEGRNNWKCNTIEIKFNWRNKQFKVWNNWRWQTIESVILLKVETIKGGNYWR